MSPTIRVYTALGARHTGRDERGFSPGAGSRRAAWATRASTRRPTVARPGWACPVGSEANPTETETPCSYCCWRRRTRRPAGSRSCPRASSCWTGCPACAGSVRSPCVARRAAADSAAPEESRCCRAPPRRRASGKTEPDAGAPRSPRRPCWRGRPRNVFAKRFLYFRQLL